MKVEIITPEATLYTGDASLVSLPGAGGALGILNNHAPLISSLGKGIVKVKETNGKEQRFEVKGGTVEVNKNKVIILAE